MSAMRLLAALGLTAVLAGCGSSGPHYVQPRSFSGLTRIVGGNATQRRLALQAVRWLGEGTSGR